MKDAQACLRQNNDVVVLTLDLKGYYYSVDVTPEVMEQIGREAEVSEERKRIIQRLNMFIAEVCRVYAQQLPDFICNGRAVLPIGFLPSNILANWFLNHFDQAVVDHWNPLYYYTMADMLTMS